MHWLILLEQALIPVSLLVWLALTPNRGILTYLVQTGSTGLLLLALALTGPWLLVPWWVGTGMAQPGCYWPGAGGGAGRRVGRFRVVQGNGSDQ